MDDHKKIMLVGGATVTLLASEHPEIFKGCPDAVIGCEIESNVDCEIQGIDIPVRPEFFTMHPDIVEMDGIVETVQVSRQDIIDKYGEGTCCIDEDNVPDRRKGMSMLLGTGITGCPRIDEWADCQPAACDIDDRQSWQQMNRGQMSKKQRRKL